MSAVFNVALPVFAIILAGFLVRRGGLLGPASSEALNGFVYWIALPPLLFLGMAGSDIRETLHWPFIGAFFGSAVAVWLAAVGIGVLLYRARPSLLAMQGLNAGFGNTGYLGIPLLVAAFGDKAIPPATLSTVLMALAVGVHAAGLEIAGGAGGGAAAAVRRALLALVRNPILVSPVAGLAWAAIGLPLPQPVVTLFELTGAAAGPCALFAIGLFLGGRRLVSNLAEVTWISLLKLVLQPVICYWLAVTLFPMDPFWTACAVLLAALPTGALAFVVAQTHGVYEERTSAVILVSTILSIVPLSILLAFYGPIFAAG